MTEPTPKQIEEGAPATAAAAAPKTLKESTPYESFTTVFDKSSYVIVSFFADTISRQIFQLSHNIEYFFITVELFLIWIFLESVLTSSIELIWLLRQNRTWKQVLLDGIQFTSMLLLYVVFRMLLDLLQTTWENGNLTALETFVAYYVIGICSLAAYDTVKFLQEKTKN